MGSFLDILECPNCGQEAHSDYYYKTGEEVIICRYCGYYKSVTIKLNTDKRQIELDEDDWDIVEIKKPYASYQIRYKNNPATEIGSLITHEDFVLLKKEMENDEDVEYFSISRFKNGEIIHTIIIGNENNNK